MLKRDSCMDKFTQQNKKGCKQMKEKEREKNNKKTTKKTNKKKQTSRYMLRADTINIH
jgi:hypothetical protein